MLNTLRIAAVAAALVVGAAAAAERARADWANMNEAINQTNFTAANQCSGTLISIKERLVLINDHCLVGYVDKVEKDETDPDTGKVEKVKREI